IEPHKLAEVQRFLRGVPHSLSRIVASAANDTARRQKTAVSKKIRDRVAIKKKDIDRYIYIDRATPQKPGAAVVLSESARLPLKYFGARQIKKGVTYKVGKQSGRSTAASAFGPKIKRLGGHVF